MPINTRFDPFFSRAAGRGYDVTSILSTSGTSTAGAASSGNFTLKIGFNAIGSTIPTTLVGMPLPPSLGTNLFPMMSHVFMTSGRPGYIANIYKIGTLNLAATGDQFTHDSATFPLLRTVYGQASRPISLIPLIYVTTATATSAPVIRLRTVAGAAGYSDQDGNSTIGTIQFTFPSATTAIESTFLMRLESGDSGVRDITNIEVQTAGTAGAATIFGMEIVSLTSVLLAGYGSTHDALFGGLSFCDMYPAVATSGTATSYMCHVHVGATTTASSYVNIKGFMA